MLNLRLIGYSSLTVTLVTTLQTNLLFKLSNHFDTFYVCKLSDTHIHFVFTGRVRRSGTALHPPLPPPPLPLRILQLSGGKSSWEERGWSTQRRATLTTGILHGTTAGAETEGATTGGAEIGGATLRATTPSGAEAEDS